MFHKPKLWYFVVGILVLNAMILYIRYRADNLWSSLLAPVSPANKVFILIFFLSETFIILNGILYFFNILTAVFQYDRGHTHYAEVKQWPLVHIFIPVYNEPLGLIQRTLVTLKYLDYPNHQVIVIDSSTDPDFQHSVRQLTEQSSFTYFLTPYPRHNAKAGALNEALKVFHAPYFVVFDADFRPSRDFLKLLVPQMENDPQLGFIQTPQFYGNHSGSPVSRIAQVQQTIFYEYISEGKSVHNSVFLCGTNFILRRAALDSVSGWDEGSITEDFATSMKLAAKGWSARYYNATTAFGDGPLNLETYFTQQYRWARGTLSSFFSSLPQFLNPRSGLSVWQRLEYSLSGTYYTIGLIWMMLILAPLLYLFFHISAYVSDPNLFTLFYAPYIILSFAFYILTMRLRLVSVTDLLKAQSLTLITLPIYVQALIDTLLHRKATFTTTEKTGSPYEVPWRKMKIQWLIIGLNVTGVVYGLLSYSTAANPTAVLMNVCWASFHIVLMLYFIGTLYVQRHTA